MLPAQPNRSLIDGIDVLLALAAAERSVGSRALARRLDLEPTRVNRLLKTLAAMGLATQDADRRYQPGPGMHVLSAMSLFGSGLVRRAVPVLEGLDRFRVIVALGVLWRDQVAYLYHKEPGLSSTDALGRAGLFPATRSSIGLALLAHQSPEELRHLYGSSSVPGFESVDTLAAELTRVRSEGVAVVRNPRGTSVAASIHAPNQAPCAAVAVSGNIESVGVTAIRDAVREAAAEIVLAAYAGHDDRTGGRK